MQTLPELQDKQQELEDRLDEAVLLNSRLMVSVADGDALVGSLMVDGASDNQLAEAKANVASLREQSNSHREMMNNLRQSISQIRQILIPEARTRAGKEDADKVKQWYQSNESDIKTRFRANLVELMALQQLGSATLSVNGLGLIGNFINLEGLELEIAAKAGVIKHGL